MKSIAVSVIALLPVVWISPSHGAPAAYHRSEFDKWTTFVKRTGIKAQ